jgi:valyl-tRNA synthetase
LDAHYAFQSCESQVRMWWDQVHAGRKGDNKRQDEGKKPYTIIMPPPNVTGSLHLGHALSSTFQDILARFYRMNGRDVVWVPGTDHAGIATQMMVEKQVISQGTTREELGREAFVQRIWDWKNLYGDLIVEQMKRLGFSADWDRLCFTLDPNMNAAVNHAFVTLHDRGYVYRAQRLVNWDGQLKTVLSDLEVTNQTMAGTLWDIAYAIEGGQAGQSIVVATTRPETLFGDVAIAVHPEDERYQSLVGKQVRIPLSNRSIPIIADSGVDPEKGTGAVKVTPAHDFNDFDMGQRHGLPMVSILTDDNTLNDQAPEMFRGLGCSDARTAVLEALAEAVVGQTSIIHAVPISERSGAIVEPRVTLQWFIDMQAMAHQSIDAIDAGKMRFVPKEWTNNALQWLRNIQPWCVSRQLWWGHRLPVWYGPENSVFVARDADSAHALAAEKWGADVVLHQDEDVLDTWFSSGLWPFSTLGWPTETADLNDRYPTDVLVTGFDIIFFWVARMMMLGLEMTGRVPFRDIYIHPLIRDAQGQKMSKTKKNVVNPLDIIDSYGADALRFALSSATCGKQHMRFSLNNVEQAGQFINKIWNVVRFAHARGVMVSMHNPETVLSVPVDVKDPLNQWMLVRVSESLERINGHIQAYRFSDAAMAVHHFIWHIVCDWYVEWAKREWDHPQRGAEIQRVFLFILGFMIRILHPFMPVITEKIWHDLTGEKGTLFLTHWPEYCAKDTPVTQAWGLVHEAIMMVRRVRSLFAIPVAHCLGQLTLHHACPEVLGCVALYQDGLCQWLGLSGFSVDRTDLAVSGQLVFSLSSGVLVIPISESVDTAAALLRLKKDQEKEQKEIHNLEKRLLDVRNQPLTPEEIIEDLEIRYGDKKIALEHINQTIHAVLAVAL